MDVILNHHLQSKRGMIKQRDQQKDHEDRGGELSQPGDEAGVVASGMSDHRRDEPQCERDEGDCRNALGPPVLYA
jgi:hypothetical protein